MHETEHRTNPTKCLAWFPGVACLTLAFCHIGVGRPYLFLFSSPEFDLLQGFLFLLGFLTLTGSPYLLSVLYVLTYNLFPPSHACWITGWLAIGFLANTDGLELR